MIRYEVASLNEDVTEPISHGVMRKKLNSSIQVIHKNLCVDNHCIVFFDGL